MQTNVSQTVQENIPEHSLYSKTAIDIATAFGSMIAGAFLIASNLKKLGRSDEVFQVYIFNIISFSLLMFLLIKIPFAEKIPDFFIQLLQVAIVHTFTRYKLGNDLENHGAQKGVYYSKWRAVGISMLLLPFVIGIFLGINYLSETKVDFGNGKLIYYKYDANKEDASKLGDYLQRVGVFDNDNEMDIYISKISNDIDISFTVIDKSLLDEELVLMFDRLRTEIQQNVFFKQKVKIIINDAYLNPIKIIQ